MAGPELHLVVKNSAGDDLLNTNTDGSFQPEKIRLYKKDNNGTETAIYFNVVPAVSFGNDFKYNTIHAYAFGDVFKSGVGNVYLKLGDDAPIELNIQLDGNGRINKLLINNQEAEKNLPGTNKYVNIFYFTK